MSGTCRGAVVDLQGGFGDRTTANVYENAAESQGPTGEVCPDPHVELRRVLQGLQEAALLVQETDHVPGSENVPKAVADRASAEGWTRGDGRDQSFLRRE